MNPEESRLLPLVGILFFHCGALHKTCGHWEVQSNGGSRDVASLVLVKLGWSERRCLSDGLGRYPDNVTAVQCSV